MNRPANKSGGPSRRALLRGGALAGAATTGVLLDAEAGASALSTGSGAPATAPAGDLILTNGQIHTMDGRDRVVRVLGVRGGEIVYAGDRESSALREFTERPRVLDLRGRTAVPGIIDCHNHIVLMGNRPGYHTPLENAYSIADVQAVLRERARRVPAGAFVTTIGGFHPNQFAEVRLPTLAELDAAVPDRPVYLSVGFAGPSVTNSAGKAFFERVAAPDGPVPVGADGAIGAGTPTGQATLALRRTLTFEDRKRGVRDAMAYAASLGVTTHLDQGAFQATGTPSDGAAHEDNNAMHLPFLAVYRDGDAKIRLRVNFLHADEDPGNPTLAERLRNAFPLFGDDMVRTGGIGEFVAPVPTDPIGDGSANNVRWLDAATKVARAGWRAEVHSLTATDFKAEIEGFELVNARHPIGDLRWVVAHATAITEEYAGRLRALGGGVNVTGFLYFFGAGTDVGPPYRMLLDSGVPLGMSSDGMQIAPMNPWIHAYYATTGTNARGAVVNGGQVISRREALAHYTRENTWFLGGPDEGRLGVLEPGRLGDVAVLDRDYFSSRAVSDVRKIHSVLTVLGGTVVHDTGAVR